MPTPRRHPPARPVEPGAAASTLLLFNKPYGVLCQFTGADPSVTLAGYIDTPDVYPAGRLDRDSEGLLLLTNDGALQSRITNPRHELPKTYCVQVDGQIDEAALSALARGVVLSDGPTRPAKVRAIAEPGWLWPRDPPVRYRRALPTSWLELTITEGRNRQIRRMTAAVGFPTLRLIRVRIGPTGLGQLAPGQWAREPAGGSLLRRIGR